MTRLISRFCALVALTLTSAAPLGAQDLGAVTFSQGQETNAAPALWKVEDDDTTIYLFGTVHLLPGNVQWLNESITNALASSDLLITEIPAGAGNLPEEQAAVVEQATLPGNRRLRAYLSDEQRERYEMGLAQLGAPPEAFDRMKPWFAGINLAVIPLVQAGYEPGRGVEEVLEALAPPSMDRGALETLNEQMTMLDRLPPASQIEFLMSVSDPAKTVAVTDQMVNHWVAGDVSEIARITKEESTDRLVSEVLLFSRNERWADWIEARMKRSGTVFIAVGAAHLAGELSVQDYLEQRELVVTRIQ